MRAKGVCGWNVSVRNHRFLPGLAITGSLKPPQSNTDKTSIALTLLEKNIHEIIKKCAIDGVMVDPYYGWFVAMVCLPVMRGQESSQSHSFTKSTDLAGISYKSRCATRPILFHAWNVVVSMSPAKYCKDFQSSTQVQNFRVLCVQVLSDTFSYGHLQVQ